MTRAAVSLQRLGLVDYGAAWRWQQERVAGVQSGAGMETLALLQHPPVFTLGTSARRDHVLVEAAELRARGAAVVDADRGGGVTFHGPGQLIAYAILDLRQHDLGPVEYVRTLEGVAIEALDRFGIAAERVPGRPGVWAAGAKVAALGIRLRRGVTMHGLALNVTTDLNWFSAIVPCGLAGVRVASMADLLGYAPAVEDVEAEFAGAFARRFDVDLVAADEGSSVSSLGPCRAGARPELARPRAHAR